MSLRPAYRCTCDRPRCKAAAMVPHERAGAARTQLVALGWTFLRHRTKHAGIVRRGWNPQRRDRQDDVGGGPRLLALCPAHERWRPRRGKWRVVDGPGWHRLSSMLGLSVATLQRLEANAARKLEGKPVDTRWLKQALRDGPPPESSESREITRLLKELNA